MDDIINVLPDSLANQIAAGEVVQRPSSVVKELVENSVDAGASIITVNIKDAGRTLIQVVDNGMGMSARDALICFERHSTSKIKTSDDLFCIYTKGFRGEALASISSVSQVELKTKREQDEVGTHIIIEASNLIENTIDNCATGTNFMVKNLFFNTPARRKFLKSNTTEFSHIINEFIRVALTHPQIEFNLYQDDREVYHLPICNLKQRIIAVYGKQMNLDLIPVNIQTSIVNITGYTSKPQKIKKRSDKQFFFVNNRYMKNSYFHKAVSLAYDKLVMPDAIPPYFLYFDIDAHTIDVNIHPTKTEINFENAQDIFRLLQAGIKETLSKNDVVPSLDFLESMDDVVPFFDKKTPVEEPKINFDPFYNPFETKDFNKKDYSLNFSSAPKTVANNSNYSKKDLGVELGEEEQAFNWEDLYQAQNRNLISEDTQIEIPNIQPKDEELVSDKFLQIKNKYIVSPVKSGLMIVDMYRAHLRVLFDECMQKISTNADGIQKLLYPQNMKLTPDRYQICYDIRYELSSVGFDIFFDKENTIIINGIPPFMTQIDSLEILHNIIQDALDQKGFLDTSIKEMLSLQIAKHNAIQGGRKLSQEEMRELIDKLFLTSSPNYSPEGKQIIVMLGIDEIEKKFMI